MRNHCFIQMTVLAPCLAVLALLPGCEGGAVVAKGKKPPLKSGDDVEVIRVAAKPDPTPKDFGTLKGKVVFEGNRPVMKEINFGGAKGCCEAKAPFERENKEELWMIDPSGGVKNAVVYLQPLAGQYFQIPEEQLKVEPLVTVDQPYCAFRPRVSVLFPSYYDPQSKGQKPTGQKLVIKNSAICDHNFSFMPGSDDNQVRGKTLGSKQEETITGLNPQQRPWSMKCDIHGWMRAYGVILEHPYAAVTKDDGTFEIKNAPVGIPLQAFAWHEGVGFLPAMEGEQGKQMTLQPNQTLDLTIKGRS